MQTKKFLLVLLVIIASSAVYAKSSDYITRTDIGYYEKSIAKSDSYIKDRCVLDIYYPKDTKDFATVVWFHGGGMMAGKKEIPEALKEKGICVVAVNYRLYPKVKAPAFIEDAAAAVAWVFNNIKKYGGDPGLIFLSGHSAGGYLALMVSLDKKWLEAHKIDANNIAGLIPFSGQTITHMVARKEKGLSNKTPFVDELAPLFHVRADAPPLLLITGDRELELFGRHEENAYLMRMMKVAGHNDTRLFELDGYTHMMTEPAFPLLLNEIKRVTTMKAE